jgi:hypothetical protein
MKKLGCFIAISLVMCVPAMAGDLTLFGGYQHPGNITLSSVVTTSVGTVTEIVSDPSGVGVFGVRFSHGKVFGAEHTLAYAPHFLDSNSHAVIYNSDVMFQVPAPVVRPYATAGAGAFFVAGSGPTDIGTKFAINYGGGVKFFPAGPIGARVDVRGYLLPSVQDQTLKAFEVSLGIVFGH